jgi:hypothetical protein
VNSSPRCAVVGNFSQDDAIGSEPRPSTMTLPVKVDWMPRSMITTRTIAMPRGV